MEEPAPMNHGDCYKLRLSDHWDWTVKFEDPRPVCTISRNNSPIPCRFSVTLAKLLCHGAID